MLSDRPPERVGDDAAGFTIAASGNVVRLVGWGFWSPEVASQLDLHVLRACDRDPGLSELVLDLTELKPMRDEGQLGMVHLLQSLGSIRVTIITRSQLTRLQLMRLVKETKHQAEVTFR